MLLFSVSNMADQRQHIGDSVLGLIAGAIVGEASTPYFSMNKSLSALLNGGFVFLLYYLFVRKKGNELAKGRRYRPKVIRILPAPQSISRG